MQSQINATDPILTTCKIETVRDVSADGIEGAFHVRLVPSVDTSEINIDREYLVVIEAKYRTKRAIVKIVVRKRYKATIG
jgi:hypothetical protein